MPLKTNCVSLIISYFCAIYLAFSCGGSTQKPLNTVVEGQVNIAVDESFMPMAEALRGAFEARFQKANIQAKYTSESQAINLLKADSVACIVIGRPLSAAQLAFTKATKVTIHTTLVATDAVALLLHPSNPDSLIDYQQIKQILSGQITHWNQINKTNPSGQIQVIIDRNNSSNLTYLKDKFGLADQSINKTIFDAGSSAKTIEYVAKNKGAIGIIGYGWLSDNEDLQHKNISKITKLAAISSPKDTIRQYFQPTQAHILTGQYPFCRQIYVANGEARVGLASGFLSYIMSDPGQRIILKHGLKPAVNLQREVRFN